MTKTIYKNVPARIWLMKKETGKKAALTLVSTKAYRRIMDEVEHAMRNGGAVEIDVRVADRSGDPRPESGDIQEWISATIDHEAEPVPMVPPSPPRERRQLRLLDIARAA
jgi:hypothetical protein